ncbi:SDR family NAD(P)-dependent oxidoreductase [Aeromicrobium phragmitis]|nr:SDR family NAD(P)-dependent oxidoreductase [Aeromicrobium phragmitis]
MGVLDGRVVVITGGAGGLGRAYSRALARDGAQVVINELHGGSTSAAEVLRAEIVEAGGQASVFTGDVSDWSIAEQLVNHAVDAHGDLHVVVNNAGFLRDSMLATMTEQEFDDVVGVHLKGTFNVSRHASAYWRAASKEGRRRDRSMINTTSGSALHANPGQANYAAAKAGIVALTQVAAKELHRHGVRANCIAPVARTGMTTAVPALSQGAEGPEGFDRFDPANVSPLVQLLARPTCRFSGHVFRVTGGRLGVYRSWHLAEEFHSDTSWTVDELDDLVKDLDAMPHSEIPWHDGVRSHRETPVSLAHEGRASGAGPNR